MGGIASPRARRRRGWTAFIIAVGVEISVLAGVAVYAGFVGGPTFESARFLARTFATASPSPATSSRSQVPREPAEPSAEARPVEVDACTLVTAADINGELDTRFRPDSATAGPDDESGDSWWTSCSFAEYPYTERSFTVTIVTGDDLDLYRPDSIDPDPLAAGEVPDDTARAIPGLGEEAWIVAADLGDGTWITLGLQEGPALVLLEYGTLASVDVDQELSVIASMALVQLPEVPKIVPRRLGRACSAIPLEGAEAFLGSELVGGREVRTAAGDVNCGFGGLSGDLQVRLLSKASAAAERSFFRETGEPFTGVGDEAYVFLDEVNEVPLSYFYVRQGKQVFLVFYDTYDGEPDDRTEPTSAEIRLLKSLLGADVITG